MHTRVLSGVARGSVLGLFISGLPCVLLDSIMWLFADDAKLVFNSLNFNEDLVQFCNWNQANGMLVNAKKSLCISFGTVEPMLEYTNITIPQECVKDLGVYGNRKLKWNTHTQCKVTNSRRAFYKLKNTIPWSTTSQVQALRRLSCSNIPLWFSNPLLFNCRPQGFRDYPRKVLEIVLREF